jgi:hypothetical protein
MAWFKDIAAGVGLVVFFTSSFLLVGAVQGLLAA